MEQHLALQNDAGEIKNDLFIMSVLKYYFAETIVDNEKMYTLLQNYRPLAWLSGEQFATLGEIYTTIRYL